MEHLPRIQGINLLLERCPWCDIARPQCGEIFRHPIESSTGNFLLKLFFCSFCGGPMATQHMEKRRDYRDFTEEIFRVAPKADEKLEGLPPKVEHFLNNARDTFQASSASIMASASAVDAMLKEKDYKDGSLYKRIEDAANDNLLTEGMKDWAHEVRLDANDERHADVEAAIPTKEDAERAYDFAETLANLVFVLPARIQRGRNQASQSDE